MGIESIFPRVVTHMTGSQEDETVINDYIEESISIEPYGTPIKISSNALNLSLIFTFCIILLT